MNIDKAMQDYLSGNATQEQKDMLLDYSLKALNCLIVRADQIRMEGR